jgi:hypothetical protein
MAADFRLKTYPMYTTLLGAPSPLLGPGSSAAISSDLRLTIVFIFFKLHSKIKGFRNSIEAELLCETTESNLQY